MMLLTNFLSAPWAIALGWTVLHSLWQALLLVLLLSLVFRLRPGMKALWRYRSAYASLVLVFILAILNFYQSFAVASTPALVPVDWQTEGNLPVQFAGSSHWEGYQQWLVEYLDAHLPAIVGFWLIGFAFFALRLLNGFAYVHRLRCTGIVPLDPMWQSRLDQLVEQLPLRRTVKIQASSLVVVPAVIGFVKPLILLPVGLVNRLEVEEVEAILVHELGHIWRQDYLLNIIQSMIEVLFYFNPAVWWISALIRIERENSCDDMAVELCGNSLLYAKSLMQLQGEEAQGPTLAMTLFGKKMPLLKRIQRILAPSHKHSSAMEKLMITLLLLIGLSCMSLSKQAAAAEANPEPIPDPSSFVILQEPTAEPSPIPKPERTWADTLPPGRFRFHVTDNGKKVKARIEDGQLKELSIDEKEIPQEELKDYKSYVEELLANAPPPPPPPPAPPTPAASPAPAVPPAPPTPAASPAPAVPPAPPAPAASPAPAAPPSPPSPAAPASGVSEYYFKNEVKHKVKSEKRAKTKSKSKMKPKPKENNDLSFGQIPRVEAPVLYAGLDFMPSVVDTVPIEVPLSDMLESLEVDLDVKLAELQQLDLHVDSMPILTDIKDLQLALDELEEVTLDLETELQAMHTQLDFFNKRVKKGIEQEMLADQLIRKGEDYRLHLNKKHFRINGKEQSDLLHKKYLKLFRELSGQSIKEGTNISIREKL